jgi:DNA topoisomerase 2-associated protein PAT1
MAIEHAFVLAVHSLQGALGKTSGRSYKAAPRQLLQVDAGAGASPTLSHATANSHIGKNVGHHHPEGAAKEAAKLGREALGSAADVRSVSGLRCLAVHLIVI